MVTNSAQGNTLDYTKRMELFANRRERETYDDLADFYAVIKATEMLETAYSRGSVPSDRYTKACKTLISGYTIQEKVLCSSKAITDGLTFMRRYDAGGARAKIRLVDDRVPATTTTITSSDENERQLVFDATHILIQVYDAVEVNMRSKKDLLPLLTDALEHVNRLAICRPDHTVVQNIEKWMKKLVPMHASEAISEADAAEMNMDMNAAVKAFRDAL